MKEYLQQIRELIEKIEAEDLTEFQRVTVQNLKITLEYLEY